MTNGECIYRKTVDFMSRMALEKDDFFSDLGISCYRKLGRGARCTKVGNGPLRILSRKNNEPMLFFLFRAMTVITSISDRLNVSLVHV